jgi:hypothetical protein
MPGLHGADRTRHQLTRISLDDERVSGLRGAALMLVGLLFSGCTGDAGPESAVNVSRPVGEAPPTVRDASNVTPVVREREIWQFCGGCHQFPDPQNFAKREWHNEVAKGFGFYRTSGRVDLKPPPQESVAAYFVGQAPDEVEFPSTAQVALHDKTGPIAFEALTLEAAESSSVAIARIEPDSSVPGRWWFTDMRGGKVWEFTGLNEPLRQRWSIPNPCSVCRLNTGPDGVPGYVVADLGSFRPEDHQRGGLWWIPEGPDAKPRPMVTGLGRVSHLVAADLDADGDEDLVVSQFGWRTTGRLQVFWNDAPSGEWPHLRAADIDPRHGALRAEICDFDGDGRLEIVAAFAQEFESVEVYRIREDATFERFTLYRAPDPSWGTSDFALADIDGDKMLDVIVCHGDSFDGGHLSPHQGITWLRQTEPMQVVERQLAAMPGVHRAVPADLDGDGDLDLAAVSLLPDKISKSSRFPRPASVVWLEQKPDLQFVPHVLEWDTCHHATCAVGDFDGDGALDILVGEISWAASNRTIGTVFRNRGPSVVAGP